MDRQSPDYNNPAHKRKLIESEVDVEQMIIIDNGTETIKIGRSGVDYPSVIIDTVAGVAHVFSQNDATPPKRVYFGKELVELVQAKKYRMQYSNPIENSIIPDKNIDDMIDLWQYALVDLMGVDKTNANILMIDSPINSKQYKAKLAENLFEKVKINKVLFMNSSVLSLFSIGCTIGLVTQIGHGTTTCVPVFQGFILNHALEHSEVAGKAITNVLQEELNRQKIKVQSKDPLSYSAIIKAIKQKNVKVAYDYDHQLQDDDRTQQQMSYELPDGQIITLDKTTVFKPAQILFQPKLINSNAKTLTEMIMTSLSRCNEDLQTELTKNMIFCGGSSLLYGLQDRISKQLGKNGQNHKLIFDWQRRYSAWIGASMIGSLSTFQRHAIQKVENNTNEIIKKIF